ncbi:MAG: DUF1361 domain-containing protein [Anaerolineales bacterium]|nr:DUF1361 domain-containing protein [Anaerolineales bacterium]
MFSYLQKAHRFLYNQSVYPLVLASFLSVIFLFGRFIYAESLNYRNLVWNLFLAWVPYGFSLIATLLHRLFPKAWLVLLPFGAAWLAFFPNAPYIVTDFYHLTDRPPVPLWYDIMLIAIYAFTGCFLAIASLRSMHILVEHYLGRLIGWLFVAASLALSGLGVYLGRFGRWNSWDILLQPKDVLKDIAVQVLNPLDNLRFIGFTLMFTAILFVFYLMFLSMRHPQDAHTSTPPG